MAREVAPRAADYEVVMEGEAAAIRLAQKACAEYRQAIAENDRISVKRRTHLDRYFRAFCEHDDFYKRLNPEQFKREATLKLAYPVITHTHNM